MKSKFLVPVIAFMFLLNVVLPFAVYAQDTAVPAFETATELAQETVTPVPTETAVPAPPPIDPTKVYEGSYSTIIALVAALVLISFAGIVAAFFSLPPWARPIVLGIAKNALDEADKIAAKTPTQIDNIGLAELREALAKLEAKQNQTQAQVNAVAGQVESNTQAVQAVARSQNS